MVGKCVTDILITSIPILILTSAMIYHRTDTQQHGMWIISKTIQRTQIIQRIIGNLVAL